MLTAEETGNKMKITNPIPLGSRKEYKTKFEVHRSLFESNI